MELDLALALPTTNSIKNLGLDNDHGASPPKKRSLCKAFAHKHGDDDDKDDNVENPHSLNKLKRVLIGWPPIKCRENDINNSANNGRNRYVKVKMEGMAIGRKLDISILGSYRALNCTLRQLFPIIKHSDDNSVAEGGKEEENYAVTYVDEEGDWMLVGDVPWETFIGSVKRLKIHWNQSQY